MQVSFIHTLICLIAGIALIVLLTAKYRVHALFALILSCFVVGLGAGFPVAEVLTTVKDGFGNIMKSLGLLIVLGTTLGVLLEHTGSTRVMAGYLLNLTGPKHAALAMSLTGFIVGLPIFCDSGYIVLSGLNNSMARRTGISVVSMSVCLATGLYSVHCLMPPHPGASAAVGIIGAAFGRVMLLGLVVSVPAIVVGYIWAVKMGKKYAPVVQGDQEVAFATTNQPAVITAFLPVIVPILLITLKAFSNNAGSTLNKLLVLGDPVLALAVGIILAFACRRNWNKADVSKLLQDGAEKAGGILVIIGAGGAFGAVLAATKIGDHLSAALPLAQLGLFFPFIITSLLKTAQGSSTVAIITAASIVLPLLPALELNSERGHLLAVLSIGAGSLMISHANDAYFWVIAKFSGMEMQPMLRVYSVATVLMGFTAIGMVYLLSKIIS
jgi:GntP family gluconate:H+ symporter